MLVMKKTEVMEIKMDQVESFIMITNCSKYLYAEFTVLSPGLDYK